MKRNVSDTTSDAAARTASAAAVSPAAAARRSSAFVRCGLTLSTLLFAAAAVAADLVPVAPS